MAIIATGSKTIIDLSDGKSLSAYLGSNQPRTQINDVNAASYSPDWTSAPGQARDHARDLRKPDGNCAWQRRAFHHLEAQRGLRLRGRAHNRRIGERQHPHSRPEQAGCCDERYSDLHRVCHLHRPGHGAADQRRGGHHLRASQNRREREVRVDLGASRCSSTRPAVRRRPRRSRSPRTSRT